MRIMYIVIFSILFILSGCNVETKQCTKEGKICEDGTILSRGGINCEFPECPKSNQIMPIKETYGNLLKEVSEDEIILNPGLEQESEPTLIIKEFDIIAKTWDFEPNIITVNQGDKVILHITSVDVTHGFRLSAFDIDKDLILGETIDVEFIADHEGEFTYYCSIYCGSGHSHMKGKLIVE